MTEPGKTSITVLVRVRPLLPRESKSDVQCLVSMPGDNLTKLKVPPTLSIHKEVREETKTYKFDESIWSFNKDDPNYTDNQQFYSKTGLDIIDHFFQGYNVCLLAYGQTSSGKTFTMMGDKSEPGLIPLIIRDILKQKEVLVSERINCEVRFSYSEIYNEQVKDLLDNNDKKCRVREHPLTGPYVENLNDMRINTFQEFSTLLNQGNENRSTASTSMNDRSSRSHAIITLTLKQTKFTQGDADKSSLNIGDADEEMVSSIKLVDLAGSERLAKTKVYGQQDRMKEGSLINKSLTVLGRCINILATQPKAIIPYRDSVLTYLLRENLGGNSKSFMIFCISPIDFEETQQTLNYANQVKMIKTTAKANKTKLSSTPIDWQELQRTDHDAIASLKDEINNLTSKLHALEVEGSSQHQDKFNRLMNYFETETSKVKFENKFLKKQLNQQSTQITELNKYIDYMTHEYNHLHSDLAQLQRQTFNQQKARLMSRCEDAVGGIESELAIFDPRTF